MDKFAVGVFVAAALLCSAGGGWGQVRRNEERPPPAPPPRVEEVPSSEVPSSAPLPTEFDDRPALGDARQPGPPTRQQGPTQAAGCLTMPWRLPEKLRTATIASGPDDRTFGVHVSTADADTVTVTATRADGKVEGFEVPSGGSIIVVSRLVGIDARGQYTEGTISYCAQ